MIFIAPLQPGTVLANVQYKWITGGVAGSAQTTGVTQPTSSFPVFRINAAVPTNAEELFVFDSTDVTNWTTVNPTFGLAL